LEFQPFRRVTVSPDYSFSFGWGARGFYTTAVRSDDGLAAPKFGICTVHTNINHRRISKTTEPWRYSVPCWQTQHCGLVVAPECLDIAIPKIAVRKAFHRKICNFYIISQHFLLIKSWQRAIKLIAIKLFWEGLALKQLPQPVFSFHLSL
jgi:hypothetical protein